MENENKDFFDYDSYIKSKGKKKNNKKKGAVFVNFISFSQFKWNRRTGALLEMLDKKGEFVI